EQTLLSQLPQGLSKHDLHAAWDLLRTTLEPPGLGAKDLRECLLLQIDAKERSAAAEGEDVDLSLERTLVDEHLKDIEANRLPKIAKAVDRTVEEVKQAILNLRQFQPHPGRLLASDSPRTINPDAIVEYDEENDTYTARLTNNRIPS